LEANPLLPTQGIRDLLRRTATPMPYCDSYEVGAGMLNAHAAVLAAVEER
jgi:serine protease AprX